MCVELLAPAAEATAAFQAIPDVAEVQTVAVEGPKSTLRLIPRDKQALLRVFDNSWLLDCGLRGRLLRRWQRH